jgi:predicted dehydrogenase
VRVHGARGELVAQHVDHRTRVWTHEREWEVAHHESPPFWEAALDEFFAYLAGQRAQPVPPAEVLQGRRILDATWRSLEEKRRITL